MIVKLGPERYINTDHIISTSPTAIDGQPVLAVHTLRHTDYLSGDRREILVKALEMLASVYQQL